MEEMQLSPEERSNKIRGYKATLSNPNVSEEAKSNARQALKQLGDDSQQGEDDDGKDPNRVAGGLKAAISNPGVSEEGKKEAQKKLDQMS
ncbi:MAG: hypothetical protein M1823_004292 [Watsoniomyces obsoletus]|nr:MAG: hypothetical protein M1823_004292 [Watsoniomyces obsoletus]